MGNCCSKLDFLLRGPQPSIAASTLGFSSVYCLAHSLFKTIPALGLGSDEDAILASSRIGSFVHAAVVASLALPSLKSREKVYEEADELNTVTWMWPNMA